MKDKGVWCVCVYMILFSKETILYGMNLLGTATSSVNLIIVMKFKFKMMVHLEWSVVDLEVVGQ